MAWIILIPTCFLLCSAAAQQQDLPIMKDFPTEIVLYEGSTHDVKLDCTLENSNPKNITYFWKKNNFVHFPGMGKPQLVFSYKTTRPKDTGLYQCFAQTPLGLASSEIVNVRRAYVDPVNVTSETHSAIEGKPFEMSCKIPNAYPKLNITWIKHDLKTKENETVLDRRITIGPNGHLYFTNVTKEDATEGKKYFCIAESLATNEPVVLAEHVIEKLENSTEVNNGELVPLYLSDTVKAKIGEKVFLYCIYGGTPLAHPNWSFGGKSVNNKPDDRVTRHNRSAGKRLLIKHIYVTDEGNYTCEVNNGVGKPQKHTIQLEVYSQPKFKRRPLDRVMVKAGEDVVLPCQILDVTRPTVSWSLNSKKIDDSFSYMKLLHSSEFENNTMVADLTIKNAQKGDTGYYGCLAENDHGVLYDETLLFVV